MITQETNGKILSTDDVESATVTAVLTDPLAAYQKCITCKDHGKNCKGPKLSALQTISNVREYHRRLRDYRKIPMRLIFALTEREISNGTVKDYFSHEEKDFRWTTVALIDNAITTICAELNGIPPVDVPPCPATSSEIREQIEAERNKLQQAEEECLALQAKIAENKGKHIEQMNDFRKDLQERVEWLKSDVRLWRKIAFVLLGIVAITTLALLVYVIWDIITPNAGLFRM